MSKQLPLLLLMSGFFDSSSVCLFFSSPSHIYLTEYSSQTHHRNKYTMIVLRRLSKVRWNKNFNSKEMSPIHMDFNVENWYVCCYLLPSECLKRVNMDHSAIKSPCSWADKWCQFLTTVCWLKQQVWQHLPVMSWVFFQFSAKDCLEQFVSN